MELHDSTLLVAGGASGLGAATARRLARHGARVIVFDRDEAAGGALADELGTAARFVGGDVADPAAVQHAIDTALAEFGGLRGAINCAGILGAARVVGRDGPHDLELFRRVVEVNLIGTFNVCRLVAAAVAEQPPMVDGERGVLINTSSVAAYEGQIGQAAYSASKGAVAAITLPLARELARLGIRVVAIAPGIFDTPMMAKVTPELRASLESQVPFPKRFGEADEFAALVEHAMTNRMLNGAVLRLDGAVRMGPQ